MFKTIFAVYRFYPMILPKNDFWQKKSSKDKMPRRKGSFGGKKVGKVPQSKTYSTSSQSKSHNKVTVKLVPQVEILALAPMLHQLL